MSNIKIEVETQQSFTYSHTFTCNQLMRLKKLLIKKGRSCIDNNYFEVSDTALLLYKKSEFKGANYAMDIQEALDEVNSKINQFC